MGPDYDRLRRERDVLIRLADDAAARGMKLLQVAYQESAIRIGWELIDLGAKVARG